jgi:hypothetical protein
VFVGFHYKALRGLAWALALWLDTERSISIFEKPAVPSVHTCFCSLKQKSFNHRQNQRQAQLLE